MSSRLVTVGFVVAVFVAACAPPPAPAPDPAAMVAAADALDQQFLAAFNAGDAAAMAALYWNDPEAASFPPDTMVVRGSEIAGGMSAMVEALHGAGAQLSVTESHQIPAGEVVIGWGLFTITMNGPDGAPMEMQGRYTDVKAERDGRWVYLVDHASMPIPAAPAPEM